MTMRSYARPERLSRCARYGALRGYVLAAGAACAHTPRFFEANRFMKCEAVLISTTGEKRKCVRYARRRRILLDILERVK